MKLSWCKAVAHIKKFVQCVNGRKKGQLDRDEAFYCRVILEENGTIWEKLKHAIKKAENSLIQPILRC